MTQKYITYAQLDAMSVEEARQTLAVAADGDHVVRVERTALVARLARHIQQTKTTVRQIAATYGLNEDETRALRRMAYASVRQ